MGAQIRRLENTLTTIGTGIVAMAIWQTIKIILQLTLLNQMEKNEETIVGVIIAISITVILGLIECYIGFSARSEGIGKKKSGVYLVWTGLYLAAFFVVLVFEIFLIFTDFDFTVSTIVIAIIDISAFVLNIEMMVSAIKVRRLRKISAGGTV